MKHPFTLLKNFLIVGGLAGVVGLSPAAAQAPTWQTAVPVASANNNGYTVTATAPDATGANLYVTGYFAGTVAMAGALLTSAGATDVFVGKWNVASRTFTWVQRAGGLLNDQALALTVSGTSVYVAGVFVNTAGFGGINLTSGGAADAFVAKLTDAGTTGTFVWVQPVGGANEDRATALAVTGNTVYLTGTFRSQTATLGTLTVNNPTSVAGAPGVAHVFLTRLADAGASSSFTWARAFGGQGADDQAAALAVSGSNVYVAGDYSGGLTLGATTLTSNGGRDAYVLKFQDTGTAAGLVWAKSAGGSSADWATALAVNGANVYVAGNFGGLAIFDVNGVVSAGTTNVFIAKLADAGTTATFTWAQQAGGTAVDQAAALAVSGPNVYVAGAFTSATASFGATNLANASAAVRSADVFVARLNDTGPTAAFVWAQKAGGTGADQAASLSVVGTTLQVGGSVTPPATFGAQAITVPSTTPVGFEATLATGVLGTAAPAALVALAVFPSPAHGGATVWVPAVPGVGTATLTVLDALGRAVRSQSALPDTRVELDLTGLPAGLYAVRVAAGGGTATRRLVLE